MKKTILLLSVAMFFLLFSNAMAGFYVITGANGRPVGKEITALPANITSSGFYYITSDLTCAAGNDGVTIAADNVTIDLMGFTLTGPGGTGAGYGININGGSNITIRNGTVQSFADDGINNEPTEAIGINISGIRVVDNGGEGIRLVGHAIRVEGCTAMNNAGNGIYGYAGAVLTGNTSLQNGNHGLSAPYGAVITNNTSIDNTNDGIYAFTDAVITNNSCRENGGNGIRASVGSTLSANSCRENGGNGIMASGAAVIGNSCSHNTGFGFDLSGGNNLLDQNSASFNSAGSINSSASCTITDANWLSPL